MISLHMKPDVNTSVTWDVVNNGEYNTPIGEVHVYDLSNVEFIPAVGCTVIDMKILAEIVKAFPIRGHD